MRLGRGLERREGEETDVNGGLVVRGLFVRDPSERARDRVLEGGVDVDLVLSGEWKRYDSSVAALSEVVGDANEGGQTFSTSSTTGAASPFSFVDEMDGSASSLSDPRMQESQRLNQQLRRRGGDDVEGGGDSSPLVPHETSCRLPGRSRQEVSDACHRRRTGTEE